MKIGLIGCGRWGQFILRDLITLGCTVTVIAIDAASCQRAQEGGAARLAVSVEDMGTQDGYIVCTPATTRYHLIQAIVAQDPAALIFVEKPLCTDLSQAEQLARQLPSSLFVMDKWRYHRGILALKALIDDREFGAIRYITTKRLSNGTTYSEIDPIWLLAPHDLSIVLELLGTLPTPMFAQIEHTDGKVRGLQACLGIHPYVWMQISDCYPTTVREVAVYFDRAVAILTNANDTHLTIYSTTHEGKFSLTTDKRPFEVHQPLFEELRAFLIFIRGGAPPKSSVAEGASIVNTIIQLHRLSISQFN